LDSQVPRRADFCIAVTEQLGHVLRRRGVREDGLAWIAPAGRPAEIGAPPGRTASSGLICYAGNLDAYQNLAFLLRSFERVRARLPGARLVVVTHADPGVRHDALGRSGVEVVWAASYDEVQGRLAAADVAVSPRAERSGFPMKLLNYMAAGKAIVASAGSAKGLVDGVTARIVPDGDEEAFAAAVIELLEDRVLRERLGAAARAAIEDVAAWETVLDRIESVYAQVVVPARARATIVGRAGVVGVGAGVEKE